MKIILVIFLCITGSECRVLKDDLTNSGSASPADRRNLQSQLLKIMDTYGEGSITVFDEIIFDVKQGWRDPTEDIVSDTSTLPPDSHKWEIILMSSLSSVEEINRVISIVRKTATVAGQLIDETCTPGNIVTTCTFNINIGVKSEPTSKIHKREIKLQNVPDTEEITALLILLEAADIKNTDFRNCTTVDGALKCNVYLPGDYADQSSSTIHKRDTESQNNTQPIDEDEFEVDSDFAYSIVNNTVAYPSDCTTVECFFKSADIFVTDDCPYGYFRADDGTCVEEI